MRIVASRRTVPDHGAELVEARSDVTAVTRVLTALDRATTCEEVARVALDTVRDSFGWAYGSYWMVAPEDGELHFTVESGDAGPEFRAVTRSASFAEGVGLSGRAWKTRDLFFVADLGEMTDCVRAPVAQRVGVKSGVCFPIIQQGRVVGTMDFFTMATLAPSAERLDALRAVGLLVSQAFGRVAEAADQKRAAGDVAAINGLLRGLARARTQEETLSIALDTIRREFDWHYGSYWALDASTNDLRFAQESGDLGAEFRRITLESGFAKGVGVAGRTWAAGELVFVEDLGQVHDCVRAPAARNAGVRSGVCLPITVGGRIVGTMDFFAKRTLILADSRRDALRNTAFLISQTLERLAATQRIADAGREMVASIDEVERNVAEATKVAGEGQRVVGEATGFVAGLGRSSAEIDKVVKVITGIAEQTNLLALNATIEAARAGEAGKGFAVVAGEVKELARETAQATEDVSSRVAAIQGDVQDVVGALASIRDIVERINETQHLIGGVLTEQAAVTRSIVELS
ncbi:MULTISPECIES: GAF domain-containing protein [unclassified Modestobacter]|uniref:GAF domain-containing protein n=1 Tax=unclassified Modestobacter TaxID=2643866 RepID=UPI0022A9FCCC|nr:MULTISPECIES: GAF domain-containing protein [unclassified Modestobacter]